MDINKFMWFFPWIWYFFSFEIYTVEAVSSDLKVPKEKRKTNGFVIILSTIIAGFLIRNTNEEFWKAELIDNLSLRILLSISCIFLVVLLRRIQSTQMRKKMNLDEEISHKRVRITILNRTKGIVRIIILYFLIIIFLDYFLRYKYIFSFFCFILFFYFMLRLNLNVVFPVKINAEIYIKEKR